MEKQEKTTLSKKEQIKLLKEISSRLASALNDISWTHYYTNYLKENIKEEKDHLRMKPEGVKHGLTAYEGGLLFSVQQIIEYFANSESKPCFEGYIYCRKSIYTAYSLVKTYNEQIKNALQGIDYSEVLKMDYCELVK